MAGERLKGGLLLDSKEGVLRGGESGAAVVPGDVTAGTLLEALRYEGLEMPPDQQLPPSVIADFERWIREGAADPREGDAPRIPDAATEIDFEAAREFWSLRPIRKPEQPSLRDPQWPRSGIDSFVLSRREERGLRTVGDAEPESLLRRLYFDLIGLPPRPEEIDAFLTAVRANRESAVRDLCRNHAYRLGSSCRPYA